MFTEATAKKDAAMKNSLTVEEIRKWTEWKVVPEEMHLQFVWAGGPQTGTVFFFKCKIFHEAAFVN